MSRRENLGLVRCRETEFENIVKHRLELLGYAFGGISSNLQDNGGVGISDPYFSDTPTTSSWSNLAQALISGAGSTASSYIASTSMPSPLTTGNPYGTTVPYNSQTYGGALSGSSNTLEYVLFGGLALVLAFVVLRKKA